MFCQKWKQYCIWVYITYIKLLITLKTSPPLLDCKTGVKILTKTRTVRKKVSGKMEVFSFLSLNEMLQMVGEVNFFLGLGRLSVLIFFFFYLSVLPTIKATRNVTFYRAGKHLCQFTKKSIFRQSLSIFLRWGFINRDSLPDKNSCLASLKKEHSVMQSYLTTDVLSWHQAAAPKGTAR